MPTNRLCTRYQRYFYLFLVGLLVLPMIVSRASLSQQEMRDKAEMNSVTQPRSASDITPLWNTTFGFPSTGEFGKAICGTDDALYNCGDFFNESSMRNVLLVTKWDHNQNIEWNRTIDWGNETIGSDIALFGENLYLTGRVANYSSHEYPMFLSRWDTLGNPLSTTFLSFSNALPTSDRIEYYDNHFYTCGSIYNTTTSDSDLLLICWDLEGTVLWNRTWGLDLEDLAWDLWINSNAIYTCGRTLSVGVGGSDLLLIKWDHAGNEIWNRTWGTTVDEFGGGIWGSTDAIYTTGSMYFPSLGKIRFILVKWDLTGNIIWNITLPEGVNCNGEDIWGIDNNHIYAIGDYVVSGMRDQMLLMQLNSNGNYSITLYGGLNYDFARELFVTYPYLYIIGTTRSYGVGNFDFFLVKYEIISGLTTPILEPITPNPNSEGKVSLTWTEVEGATSYDVYRSTENITSFMSEKLLIGSFSSLSCTDDNLPNGIYYYSVVARNATEFSRLSICRSVQISLLQKKISGFTGVAFITLGIILFTYCIPENKMRKYKKT